VTGPVLAFDRVGKVFTDHPGGTEALAEVTFAVPAGAFHALVGPSGAGKSTLLRLAADLTVPTSGTVRVCGAAPEAARLARQIGLVFQAPVLMSWRDVRANVALPLEVAGVARAERERRAREVLDLVGLVDVDRRYPHQLSGGMRQRVAIARALATQPKLLLLDEPFAAVDELTRERLNLRLLKVWRETGVTVLFVTHHVDEAVFLSDVVQVLSERPGRLVAQLPVDLPRPRDARTRLLPGFVERTAAVRAALRHAAGAVDPGSPDPPVA
jgi:NitT/TauT family transport system ATP-binding protein